VVVVEDTVNEHGRGKTGAVLNTTGVDEESVALDVQVHG
jgi:hypothetical protein